MHRRKCEQKRKSQLSEPGGIEPIDVHAHACGVFKGKVQVAASDGFIRLALFYDVAKEDGP
jgi:hypothetical protein